MVEPWLPCFHGEALEAEYVQKTENAVLDSAKLQLSRSPENTRAEPVFPGHTQDVLWPYDVWLKAPFSWKYVKLGFSKCSDPIIEQFPLVGDILYIDLYCHLFYAWNLAVLRIKNRPHVFVLTPWIQSLNKTDLHPDLYTVYFKLFHGISIHTNEVGDFFKAEGHEAGAGGPWLDMKRSFNSCLAVVDVCQCLGFGGWYSFNNELLILCINGNRSRYAWCLIW